VDIKENMNPPTQTEEEGAAAHLQPQEVQLVTKNTHNLLQMHNQEHPVWAASPPGTAIAPPTTVRLSRA
jgi:hypothetical protein